MAAAATGGICSRQHTVIQLLGPNRTACPADNGCAAQAAGSAHAHRVCAAPYRLTQPQLPAGAVVQRGVAHRACARAPLPLGRCTPPRAAPNHSPQLLPGVFNAVAASYRPHSPPPRHSPLCHPPAHTCTTPSARISHTVTGTPHTHCSSWHSQWHAQPKLLHVVAAARAADLRCGTCARNSRRTA